MPLATACKSPSRKVSVPWGGVRALNIDWRWHGADAVLAERQAAELIALKPDVLLAGGNPAIEKIRQQTKTIPVVFALVSDPVGMGYVESMARPGGNTTGFMSYDARFTPNNCNCSPRLSRLRKLWRLSTIPKLPRMQAIWCKL
jgi:ABC transporter substrate binding protein